MKHVLTGFVLLGAMVTATEAADRTQRVTFKPGAISETVVDHVKGYDTFTYIVNAKAGQSIHVDFKTKSPSCYVNIQADGEDQALFIGSSDGNGYAGVADMTGDFRISAYMMRNEARRGTTCTYKMTVTISD